MDVTALISQHKNKVFDIAIIVFALIIASNIYKHQVKEIESLKTKIDTQIKKNLVLESISRLEKRINSYRNLLSKKDISLVLNTITNIAKESDVKIISIKPAYEQRQAYSEYIKFPFNLVLSVPNYHTLGEFISKVESYKDVYIVDAVEIMSATLTKQLTVNLKISSIVATN